MNRILIYQKFCNERSCTHSISVSSTFNAIQNNNATASKSREKKYMNPPSAIICFRYRLELRNVCGQLFLSHSPFPISFFSVFLIVTMDFKAERHKTTFSNIQCQTPKNWRRNQSAKNKMASKKQVGKQKFSWKSIYDSHFLSAWVFLSVCVLGFFSLFLILLLEGVRNCLF